MRRADADRQQADAQLRLLQAGSRPEDIRQAASQVQSAQADVRAAQAELDAATADVERFEIAPARQRRLGQAARRRGDAAGRGGRAAARGGGSRAGRGRQRSRGSGPAPGRRRSTRRARASPRSTRRSPRCRRASADAVVKAPVGGIVTSKLVDAGEMAAPRVADRRHHRSRSRLGERVRRRAGWCRSSRSASPPTLITDAGQRLDGIDHVHLAEGGVHAAQRADGGRAVEARVPHQGHRRQPQRRAEAGHAGRSGAHRP